MTRYTLLYIKKMENIFQVSLKYQTTKGWNFNDLVDPQNLRSYDMLTLNFLERGL